MYVKGLPNEQKTKSAKYIIKETETANKAKH